MPSQHPPKLHFSVPTDKLYATLLSRTKPPPTGKGRPPPRASAAASSPRTRSLQSRGSSNPANEGVEYNLFHPSSITQDAPQEARRDAPEIGQLLLDNANVGTDLFSSPSPVPVRDSVRDSARDPPSSAPQGRQSTSEGQRPRPPSTSSSRPSPTTNVVINVNNIALRPAAPLRSETAPSAPSPRPPGTGSRKGLARPRIMSADAVRQISQQRLHRQNVSSANPTTDVWMSARTTAMWSRLRCKNSHKEANGKYDGFALSLKLHNNVINLDAMCRQEVRHAELLRNVKGGVDSREAGRIVSYREHRKKMRVVKLRQQEYHTQELARDLKQKPRGFNTSHRREIRAADAMEKQAKQERDGMDLSPPRPSTKEEGSFFLRDDNDEGGMFQGEPDAHVPPVASDFNPYDTSQLHDTRNLLADYSKYVPVTVSAMRLIYDAVIEAIPPLVSEEDVELEKRRAWDVNAGQFDVAEEEDKRERMARHIELMLEKLESGRGLEGAKNDEFGDFGDLGDGEMEDDDSQHVEGDEELFQDVVALDSPRLRQLRPYLTERECRMVFEDELPAKKERRQRRTMERLLGEDVLDDIRDDMRDEDSVQHGLVFHAEEGDVFIDDDDDKEKEW